MENLIRAGALLISEDEVDDGLTEDDLDEEGSKDVADEEEESDGYYAWEN